MSNSFVILWTTARLAPLSMGWPRWLSGRVCLKFRRCRFDSWVVKIFGDGNILPSATDYIYIYIYHQFVSALSSGIPNYLCLTPFFFHNAHSVSYPSDSLFPFCFALFLSPVLQASHCVLSSVPVL